MYRYSRSSSSVALWGLLLVLLATGMRFVLMSLHWPVANADESIIDLMARHLAYRGEHAIFFWGQHYMGTLQAYLGAFFIHLFGSSALSVRLGTLLIFALYLLCMYMLARLLYTPVYALVITALLSLGSERVMSIPLVANGGYAETMLFGALIFLLVTWLALTRPQQAVSLTKKRLAAYAVLGLTVGLALWSDQLILSAILAAGLFWWISCRSELRSRAALVFGAGLLLGAFPLIIYNVTAPPEQNSLFVLLGTVFSGAPRVVSYPEQLAHVLFISLPLGTGMPLSSGPHAICSTVEPYTQPTASLAALFPQDNAALCLTLRGGWSLGLLLLWSIALVGLYLALRRSRQPLAEGASSADLKTIWQQRVILSARLMLLGSALLWFLLFALSAAAAQTPRASCRYLICLLLATPAVYWPLWQGGDRFLQRPASRNLPNASRALLSLLALCVVGGLGLVGTGEIFVNLPDDQNSYNQTNDLIAHLVAYDATRVYSNYDTCSLLIFQSDERVICGVLDNQLQPGVNRYPPYLVQVEAEPHPAYLFPLDSTPDHALAQSIGRDSSYQHLLLHGYSIYYYSAPG